MWAMIAVSILLALWTAGLSYTTAKHERIRKAEFEQSGAGGRKSVTEYAWYLRPMAFREVQYLIIVEWSVTTTTIISAQD